MCNGFKTSATKGMQKLYHNKQNKETKINWSKSILATALAILKCCKNIVVNHIQHSWRSIYVKVVNYDFLKGNIKMFIERL